MNASCQRGAIAKLEGISHAQRNRLSRHLHGSVEDKWLAIWRILFPDHEPPVSIFVDADQSEDFCLFREFVQREGHVMVYDELEGTNRFLRPGVSPVELHHALRTVLDVMFERFRLERQDAPRHSQESEILSIHGGTSSAVLSRQENRGSSPGDSGVGMRSRNSFAGSTETDISTPRPTSSNRIRPSPQTDLALLYGDDLLGHAAPHSIDVSHEASVGDIGNSGDYSQLDKSGEAISTHESASNSVECFDDIFPSSMVSLRGESDLPNLDDILYDITDTRTVDDFSEFR
jgi:hypothetical protein